MAPQLKLKAQIWTVDGGAIVHVTGQELKVCQSMKEFFAEIKAISSTIYGAEVDKTLGVRQTSDNECICPRCTSHRTIGYGTRERKNQVLKRRFCHDCKRTFNVEPIDDEKDNKQKSLLSFGGYEEDCNTKSTAPNNETDPVVKIQVKRFKPAKPFSIKEVLKTFYGTSLVWDHNGRYAIGKKGSKEIVFLSKETSEELKSMTSSDLVEYISTLPDNQQEIVLEYHENQLDDKMGILPKIKINTKVLPDNEGGEIDPEVMEQGAECVDSSIEQAEQ